MSHTSCHAAPTVRTDVLPRSDVPRRSFVRVLLLCGLAAALALSAQPAVADVTSAGAAAAAPAAAAPATGVRIEVSGASGRADATVTVTATATRDGGRLPGVTVRWERAGAKGWEPFATTTTDAEGRAAATLVVARTAGRNAFRARAEDAATSTVGEWASGTVTIVKAPTTLALSAPGKVVDERSAVVRVTRRTDTGVGVPGTVALQRRVKRASGWTGWTHFRTVRTDASGAGSTTVRPRWTHRWRVVATATDWTHGSTSSQKLMKNVPPGVKVKMPKGAPKPRIKLGPQKRAVGAGANVKVKKVPASVWRSMKGRSWRRGCPVGRADLRLVETNYWAFDGYRRRGRVVVAAVVADNFRGAFTDLHKAKVPIRSMRLVDSFGYSRRLGGADDMRSMAADNTSVFNCRGVVGNPGRRSPHSWGRSLDLNPWENPYRSSWGVVPNTWWASRSHKDVAWRSGSHRVVKILARNGFRWTYGHSDLHHFDAVPGRARSGRALAQEKSLAAAVEACADTCD